MPGTIAQSKGMSHITEKDAFRIYILQESISGLLMESAAQKAQQNWKGFRNPALSLS